MEPGIQIWWLQSVVQALLVQKGSRSGSGPLDSGKVRKAAVVIRVHPYAQMFHVKRRYPLTPDPRAAEDRMAVGSPSSSSAFTRMCRRFT